MQVIGSGKAIVEMLRDFGLSQYEARIYFALLTFGEAKVGTLTKRAYVPQSKAYGVLDKLISKGFAELSSEEMPKTYRAKTLEEVITRAISNEKEFIERLNRDFQSLKNILRAISPVYEKYGSFRLFSPNFERRCNVWTRQSL